MSAATTAAPAAPRPRPAQPASPLRGMPDFLGRVSGFFRRRRLVRFKQIFPAEACRTAIDLGGSTYHWELLDYPGDVTIVNRDAAEVQPLSGSAQRRYAIRIADASRTGLPAGSFDLAFSNSVIEHVGDFDDQRRFAQEMLRLGRSVWCQTPNRWFFFETHLMTAFVHYLPRRWQIPLVRNFSLWGWINRPDRATAAAYLGITRLLTRREMEELFPGCEILTERFLGLAKSFVAVRRPSAAPPQARQEAPR